MVNREVGWWASMPTLQIIVSGFRANDMAVRLKYAGIAPVKIVIIPQIDQSIEYLLNSLDINEKITILPPYTALLKMQKSKWKH
jgi:hypothetical protein